MTNEIKPTYYTPDGRALMPREELHDEVKKWVGHNVLKAYRRLLDFAEIPAGEPCPCCRRPLEFAIKGARHEYFDIGETHISDAARKVDLR